MSNTPIALMALLFVLLAAWDWRRAPLLARLSLGVATVFALAALEYPGASVRDVVAHTEDGLAWLGSGARGLGLALVMVAVAGQVRALRD
ncbi:MAG TPA: hypothetical protein VF533_05395 [Solirubrobacteraceae bacterium]